ncbi:hypothetical protein PQE68_gp036 [Bacillus phage vB_BanS_Sophrita]|uniref:Uncharacterized protein n=1 Tax=Bacillus phage vB_BanS_Sophrita TaxID=2894790 RepID=A0AAE9CE73_9CAUD|nr:hypothetical protein PQE68_gp036 [Bacillus phage vB_BanS_Sophrita]UGO50627.1 hypothetical protein SOPHRITA_36 [Bacillus phage vB_BanS_Sophrita]
MDIIVEFILRFFISINITTAVILGFVIGFSAQGIGYVLGCYSHYRWKKKNKINC